MRPIVFIYVVGEVSSLVLAVAITYFGYRAYWRSGSTAIRSLMIGFGSLTLGLLLGVGTLALGGVDLAVGASLQSVFMTLGFGFLTYSLYVQDSRLERGTETSTGTSQAEWRETDR